MEPQENENKGASAWGWSLFFRFRPSVEISTTEKPSVEISTIENCVRTWIRPSVEFSTTASCAGGAAGQNKALRASTLS